VSDPGVGTCDELDLCEPRESVGVERHPVRGAATYLETTQLASGILECDHKAIEIAAVCFELRPNLSKRFCEVLHRRAPAWLTAHLLEPSNKPLTFAKDDLRCPRLFFCHCRILCLCFSRTSDALRNDQHRTKRLRSYPLL